MHLSRFGYNLLAMIWLAPIIVADFVGNSIYTDWQSDLYFWKAFIDIGLAACAFAFLFGEETAHVNDARSRQADHRDDVVDFAQINALEYLYCAVLCLYAVVNFISLHAINKSSTGLVSLGTLIWSFVSLAVVIISGIQFWKLKSGDIVTLKKRIVQ